MPSAGQRLSGCSSSWCWRSKDEMDVGISVKETDAQMHSDSSSDTNPGELTFEEDTAGGMGRHLGVFTCTMLNVGYIIGTGIFSTPSSILGSVRSVGASLMLWVLGFALSFCGLFIWLEFGTMFPRSGGEKVYLEAVFAENILVAGGHDADLWAVRGIAIGVISFTIAVHGLTPRLGVYIMNVLTLVKTIILAFIVVTGWVVLSGKTRVKDPYQNFRHAFAGSSDSGNDYATAMFKVLFTYSGWQNANYVLNEVRNPVRTLKIAGPLGLGITAILYIFANIAYFAASSKTAILDSGTTVASLFFENVFGAQAQKVLTVFVALSALGVGSLFSDIRRVHSRQLQNVFNAAYGAARINQELAKGGIPLPFGNRFWAANWPTQNAPFPGLIIHFIATVIVIIAPPVKVAYPFILDVQVYPAQIINLFVILGLFYLRWRKPHLRRPFKGILFDLWLPLALFFFVAEIFLLVAPFLRPANKVGDTPPLAYYLYALLVYPSWPLEYFIGPSGGWYYRTFLDSALCPGRKF
ncbi:amino acid permease-domain-containing protein [Lactifluus volemus]|nr:amino acid permease-domain-containing protein [Lactifluus volemus]